MKKKAPILGIALLFLIGAGALAYPFFSNWLFERNATHAIVQYNEAVSGLDPAVREEQLRLAREYNDALTGYDVRDPFIPGSGIVLPDNYVSVLNLDGCMGYIEIPKINVYLPIRHGTGEQTLQRNVGHVEATAFPVGGEGNHCVLTGHRGLAKAKLFTDLDRLEKGDVFYLHVLDEVLAYQVDRVLVVEPENAEALRPEAGKDYVTLITCTPYAVNSHRLLVRGERIQYLAEEEEPPPVEAIPVNWRGVIVAGFVILWLAAILFRLLTGRRKKRAASLFPALLFLIAGILVIAYPHVRRKAYRRQVYSLVEEFEEKTAGLFADNRLDELYRQIQAYNRDLFEQEQTGLSDPFSYEQADISLKDFGFEEEMAGYLTIPGMDVVLPVYLGASPENLKRGAGHLSQTSIPIGGESHNAVIAAHRDLGTAVMFRNIEALEPGDYVYMTNFWETLTYQVVEIAVIRPNEIDRILIRPGQDLLTLLTCHPHGRNDQRYVVYCRRV